jgi:hypothetical protein
MELTTAFYGYDRQKTTHGCRWSKAENGQKRPFGDGG